MKDLIKKYKDMLVTHFIWYCENQTPLNPIEEVLSEVHIGALKEIIKDLEEKL